MKCVAILVMTLGLVAAPAVADDDAAEPKGDVAEGFSLLEEGTRLLLRGLMNEMEPALREMQDALKDLDAYYPPEFLPNGDIIIRRKQPIDPEAEPDAGPDDSIDL